MLSGLLILQKGFLLTSKRRLKQSLIAALMLWTVMPMFVLVLTVIMLKSLMILVAIALAQNVAG